MYMPQVLADEQTVGMLCLPTDLFFGPMPALQCFCLCSFKLLLLKPGRLLPHALLVQL
jgi:hypothetical protein